MDAEAKRDICHGEGVERVIVMKNGKILEDDLIGRLTEKIIKELADEKLSIDEAKAILDETKEKIDETSKVMPINP